MNLKLKKSWNMLRKKEEKKKLYLYTVIEINYTSVGGKTAYASAIQIQMQC